MKLVGLSLGGYSSRRHVSKFLSTSRWFNATRNKTRQWTRSWTGSVWLTSWQPVSLWSDLTPPPPPTSVSFCLPSSFQSLSVRLFTFLSILLFNFGHIYLHGRVFRYSSPLSFVSEFHFSLCLHLFITRNLVFVFSWSFLCCDFILFVFSFTFAQWTISTAAAATNSQ
jgi:hypothetical protein